jgi:CheY-like chemotaxis protein
MPCNVLIAEDSEEDLFFLLQAMNKSKKLNVLHTVTNGREVIDYLANRGAFADRRRFPLPHLLLIDLKMPRCGGLEVLQWLKDHPFPHLMVVLLSGSSSYNELKEAERLGVDAFFTKPIRNEQLKNVIDTIEGLMEASPKSACST